MYVIYILYIYSLRTPRSLYSTLYNLSYYSLLYSSTSSILDYAYINQLASINSSPSSYNIMLKLSITLSPFSLSLSLKIPNISKLSTRGIISV